jgi:ABC-type lipoprotein export system ATPase subunit
VIRYRHVDRALSLRGTRGEPQQQVMSGALSLQDVSLEVSAPARKTILFPTSLEVRAGQAVAIVGPSGAGKTTLASILGALQPPTTGHYWFEGLDVASLNSRDLARFRGNHVGHVFQQPHLIDERSALQNVALGVVDPRVNSRQRRLVSEEALAAVGLSKILHRRAALLSGGERHRVSIARAMVKRPSVMIIDEPTAALDQRSGAQILGLLKEINALGVTMFIVSHDSRVEPICDVRVNIVDGRSRLVAP